MVLKGGVLKNKRRRRICERELECFFSKKKNRKS
jgi:hypothetical protein